LPISWNEDWSAEQHHAYSGQTYHIGFYVQQASVTFKVLQVFTFVTIKQCYLTLQAFFFLVKAIENFSDYLLYDFYLITFDLAGAGI
jgi:hypothetical protein